MSTWATHLNEHWYAVARSAKVGRKPVRILLLDRPIVLVRLDGSSVVGFEDRCPHRRAPLSRGRVVDGTLQCPYHGWRFDERGGLCEVPGAPPDACFPNIRARSVAVREHDGLIWVRPGQRGSDDIPARARGLEPKYRKFTWQTIWHANIVDAIENVLDPLHTHFVHPGLVRKSGARHATRVSLHVDDEGFVVNYEGQTAQSGLLYRLFESPRKSERAWYSAPGMVQLEYAYQNGSRARISLHFSPETDCRTRLIATFHLEGRRVPGWAITMFVWPFLRRVAKQDRRMLKLQSENTRAFSGQCDAITEFDIVRRYLVAIWHGQRAGAELLEDREIRLWL